MMRGTAMASGAAVLRTFNKDSRWIRGEHRIG